MYKLTIKNNDRDILDISLSRDMTVDIIEFLKIFGDATIQINLDKGDFLNEALHNLRSE